MLQGWSAITHFLACLASLRITLAGQVTSYRLPKRNCNLLSHGSVDSDCTCILASKAVWTMLVEPLEYDGPSFANASESSARPCSTFNISL